jgi:DNA-binding CsgD family transcriptional regulator
MLEAAYRVECPDGEWLEGLAAACRPVLDRGFGLCAFEFHNPIGGRPRILQASMQGMPTALADMYPTVFRAMDPSIQARPFASGPCTTASQMMGERASFKNNDHMRRYAQTFGMFDSLWITAAEPSGWGCGLHAGRRRVAWATPGTVARWGRVAAHFSTAARLRRRLSRGPDEAAPVLGSAVAVFSPDGHAHHAEGDAQERGALAQLRQSVLDIECERSSRASDDVASALVAWRPLVDGRWSLVDQFETGGRRYVVARDNPPEPPSIAALTLRERQIVGYAALGHENKVVAYDLGISHSTVRVLMARAASKLGVRTRAELVSFYRTSCDRMDRPAPSSADPASDGPRK